MVVNRKPADLKFLMSRRSTKTHTFVTAWGELGLMLEDVSMLASLPIFGETQVANLVISEGETRKGSRL